jgi:hypothetical protein
MPAYSSREKATAQDKKGKWLHIRIQGYLSQDGCLFYHMRCAIYGNGYFLLPSVDLEKRFERIVEQGKMRSP